MKILVVDDDVQLATIIAFTLRREGFLVQTVHDGQAALALWVEVPPDLVLLDVNLPGLDGWGVLRALREVASTPVIMLTVRSDEEDVVRGLEAGADDYIAKPFSPRTLVARIRAVLRRRGQVPASDLTLGDLTLDMDRQEVRRGGDAATRLTPLEFRLLHYLLVNRGQVLPAEALIEHVWGYSDTGDRALLRQLIRRLRSKIEPDPAQPHWIETVANVGYVLREA